MKTKPCLSDLRNLFLPFWAGVSSLLLGISPVHAQDLTRLENAYQHPSDSALQLFFDSWTGEADPASLSPEAIPYHLNELIQNVRNECSESLNDSDYPLIVWPATLPVFYCREFYGHPGFPENPDLELHLPSVLEQSFRNLPGVWLTPQGDSVLCRFLETGLTDPIHPEKASRPNPRFGFLKILMDARLEFAGYKDFEYTERNQRSLRRPWCDYPWAFETRDFPTAIYFQPRKKYARVIMNRYEERKVWEFHWRHRKWKRKD